jgi:hypothetical protein
MQKALYQFEGSISRLQIDDKGTVLKAAFGLPPLFHENDPARAVLAALHIEEGLAAAEIECTIGITTGNIFCGMVGNDRRCEYTTVGAEVNMAARLMMQARKSLGDIHTAWLKWLRETEGAAEPEPEPPPETDGATAPQPETHRIEPEVAATVLGSILCDELTHAESSKYLEQQAGQRGGSGQAVFEGPHAVHVKKRKQPLTAYCPRMPQDRRAGGGMMGLSSPMLNYDESATPLIGRDYELTQLLDELRTTIAESGPTHEAVEDSRPPKGGRLVVVEGDTGMGKTRLLRALTEAADAECTCLQLQASANWWSAQTPFHAFSPIFHMILESISSLDNPFAITSAGGARAKSAWMPRGGHSPRHRAGLARTTSTASRSGPRSLGRRGGAGVSALPRTLSSMTPRARKLMPGGGPLDTNVVGLPRTMSGRKNFLEQAMRAAVSSASSETDDDVASDSVEESAANQRRHQGNVQHAVQVLLSNDLQRQNRVASDRDSPGMMPPRLVSDSAAPLSWHGKVGGSSRRISRLPGSAASLGSGGSAAGGLTPGSLRTGRRGSVQDGLNGQEISSLDLAITRTRSISHAVADTKRTRSTVKAGKSVPNARRRRRASLMGAEGGSLLAGKTPEEQPEKLEQQHLDVLNEYLPVHFKETVQTASLTKADRLTLAIGFLTRIFRAFAAQGSNAGESAVPVLLQIENGQYLDSASLRLTTALLEAIPHLVVVLATRDSRATAGTSSRSLSARASLHVKAGNIGSGSEPADTRTTSFSEWMSAQSSTPTMIKLGSLSKEQTMQVALARLGVRKGPPALANAVFSSSHGNPYFAEQLVQTWVDTKELVVRGKSCSFTPQAAGLSVGANGVASTASASSLPQTIEQVIIERVERLPMSMRNTLKVASAVGAAFNLEILTRMNPELNKISHEAIRLDLAQLCEMDLLEQVDSMSPRGLAAQMRRSVSRAEGESSRYQDNAGFAGSLGIDSSSEEEQWDFKSATVRQTVYQQLSVVQLKAGHREVARYREEKLMRTVERRYRRHSSLQRTGGNSPMNDKTVREAQAALDVMAAQPTNISSISNASVQSIPDEGGKECCFLVKMHRTGVASLLDSWNRQELKLAAQSEEERSKWMESIRHASTAKATESDVVRGERLLEGWLFLPVIKGRSTAWKKEWFVLLPGQLVSYKEQPAHEMLRGHLNHYNAFRMDDNLPQLAEHFYQAGDIASAAKYLKYAGVLALENSATGQAAECFSRMSALESQQRSAAVLQPDSGGAEEEQVEEDRLQRAHLERLMAEAYVAAGPEHPGSSAKALNHLNRALDRLGQHMNRYKLPLQDKNWRFKQQETWFDIRTAAATTGEPESEATQDQIDLLRCYSLMFKVTRLNTPHLFCRMNDAFKAAHAGLQNALQLHDANLLGNALSHACLACCAQGHHERAARLADSASAALELITDSRSTANVQLSRAEYFLAVCSWGEAHTCLDEAHGLFSELGDSWQAAITEDMMHWLDHCRTDYFTLAQAQRPLALDVRPPPDETFGSIASPDDFFTRGTDEATMDSSRLDSPRLHSLVMETDTDVGHYALVARVVRARYAWSVLRSCGIMSPRYAEFTAELSTHLPDSFAEALQNKLQAPQRAAGPSAGSDGYGLPALCSAELCAIHAHQIIVNRHEIDMAAKVHNAVNSPLRHSADEAPRSDARTASYRALMLASEVTDGMEPLSPRALPALVAVAEGWMLWIRCWGSDMGGRGPNRVRRRRHSMSQTVVSASDAGNSSDVDSPTESVLGDMAVFEAVAQSPRHRAAQRRRRRSARRRRSMPDARTSHRLSTSSRLGLEFSEALAIESAKSTMLDDISSEDELEIDLQLPTRIRPRSSTMGNVPPPDSPSINRRANNPIGADTSPAPESSARSQISGGSSMSPAVSRLGPPPPDSPVIGGAARVGGYMPPPPDSPALPLRISVDTGADSASPSPLTLDSAGGGTARESMPSNAVPKSMPNVPSQSTLAVSVSSSTPRRAPPPLPSANDLRSATFVRNMPETPKAVWREAAAKAAQAQPRDGCTLQQSDAQVQMDGRGAWNPVRMVLVHRETAGEGGGGGQQLIMYELNGEVGEDRTVVCVADMTNSQVRKPKNSRKGHKHCFRVDLASPDDHKTVKYIVSVADKQLMSDWMKTIKTGRAVGASSATARPTRQTSLELVLESEDPEPSPAVRMSMRSDAAAASATPHSPPRSPFEPKPSTPPALGHPSTRSGDRAGEEVPSHGVYTTQVVQAKERKQLAIKNLMAHAHAFPVCEAASELIKLHGFVDRTDFVLDSDLVRAVLILPPRVLRAPIDRLAVR